MHIVAFHIDGTLRAYGAQVFTSATTGTLLYVHNRNHGYQTAVHLLSVGTNPTAVFVFAVLVAGGNQLDGARRTSA